MPFIDHFMNVLNTYFLYIKHTEGETYQCDVHTVLHVYVFIKTSFGNGDFYL